MRIELKKICTDIVKDGAFNCYVTNEKILKYSAINPIKQVNYAQLDCDSQTQSKVLFSHKKETAFLFAF